MSDTATSAIWSSRTNDVMRRSKQSLLRQTSRRSRNLLGFLAGLHSALDQLYLNGQQPIVHMSANSRCLQILPRCRRESASTLKVRSAANGGRCGSRRTPVQRGMNSLKACAYSGLRPSASNMPAPVCRGSRSRSMPMPRGQATSTAALTRLGARKASEMVILTCRTLHFSRAQSSATVVTRPETTSSSHRRPRAIALTRRARARTVSGRTSLRDALCGSRILTGFFRWRFCQGIVSDWSSGESDDLVGVI